MGSMDDFFAGVDSDHIAGELTDRVDDWHRFMKQSTLFDRMQRSYRTYYGLSRTGSSTTSRIRQAGERDEFSLLSINHYRSILQQILVMTTQQRPAWECSASNTDKASIDQCIVANGILDFYTREKHLEKNLRDATEISLVYSEGWVGGEWDANAGNIYTVDPVTKTPVYEGDIRYTNYTPLDIIRDVNAKSSTEERWKVAVEYHNKYDLAATYPNKAEEIMKCEEGKMVRLRQELLNRSLMESDLVPVFKFYHERSKALPQGRMVWFIDADLKLMDVPLPYKRIPLSRIAPGDQVDTPFGYTIGFDLLGIQEAYNILNSTVITNQKTFGVQNILVPEGHNMNPVQLFGGLNLLKYNAKNGEIKPLQLTSTAPEVFNFIGGLRNEMQLISSVNSVLRGQPDQNIKSGSFAALVAAQAIQFNSGLQNSYNQLLESVGMMTIEMLQTFAETKRVANIVGKNNSSYMKEFQGSDLGSINRVTVNAANALLKTTEGKLEMANQLLQAGQIQHPEQYITVATTGKLEAMYESQQKELQLIRDENEKMAQGIPDLSVILTDNHALHIKEHRGVLSDQSSRKDPATVNSVLTHIQQHIEALRTADPGLLMVLGEQPLPPVQPPMPQGPVPMPAPGGPAPQAPALAKAPGGNPENQPNMPHMPINGLTGKRYDPQTGGL